jgi:predicted P-loop ATPase
MVDEFAGNTVTDEKHMKELISRASFSLRAPYGSITEDRQRLCALCGTTNEEEFLKDPTGNRRFLPIRVIDTLNFELYNSIDKELLFYQAYKLYKDGYDFRMNRDDIEQLNNASFEMTYESSEEQLVKKYLAPAAPEDTPLYMSSSDIKQRLEMEGDTKLSLRKLGMVLKKLGFQQTRKNNIRCYEVVINPQSSLLDDGTPPPF